jgi:hypothetical protein
MQVWSQKKSTLYKLPENFHCRKHYLAQILIHLICMTLCFYHELASVHLSLALVCRRWFGAASQEVCAPGLLGYLLREVVGGAQRCSVASGRLGPPDVRCGLLREVLDAADASQRCEGLGLPSVEL